jgi:hypothetical protein
VAGRFGVRGGRGGVARVLLAVLALLAAAGCSTAPPPAPPRNVDRQVEQVLDRSAAAVTRHDEKAYLAAYDPRSTTLRAAETTEFAGISALPLSSWQYHVTSVAMTGGTTATVRADLRYRITGYDRAPVSAPRFIELDERAGHWYVTLDQPDQGAARQLWEQGRIDAVHGARSLVLGVGQAASRLRTIAAAADRAVPAVDKAWPGTWQRRVVVVVPQSLEAMAALLGGAAGQYRGIAAVTTGELGSPGDVPADRIIVNPDEYGQLADFGQQVVLTHEITHVATRTATTSATPTWLSEGIADWAAYRGSGRSATRIAPELESAVRSGKLPEQLPTDQDFAFGADQVELARAYEEGWLACELIAQQWGAGRLAAFYRAVGAHDGRQGSVDDALHSVLATSPARFTAMWRAYLEKRLGAG